MLCEFKELFILCSGCKTETISFSMLSLSFRVKYPAVLMEIQLVINGRANGVFVGGEAENSQLVVL